MRLDKLISHEGYGSRKEVKQLLKTGAVTINGIVEKQPKTQVNPEADEIIIAGEKVVYEAFVYYMLNKPQDVVSATEDSRDETVIDLLMPEHQIKSPFPVGRLDKDTEGLLLLTNDGKLAHRLLSPKKNVGKTYYAKIDGKVTTDDIERFKEGVTLDDGYHTKPSDLSILVSDDESEIELVITEGKFHQVKRMFEAVDKNVTYLKRLKMGTLSLDGDLGLGEYRPLTDEELMYLKTL